MKFLIVLTLIFSSLQAFCEDDFMEFGNDDYQPKKSDWLVELGAKYYEWDLRLPAYKGTHHSINTKETVKLLGPELAFGGELHLFTGLSFSLKARGFYMAEVKGELGKASKDFDYELAKVDSDATMYGGEGAASLNYTFVTELVEIQPFAEVAVGAAKGYNKVKYDFDGLVGDDSDAEFYRAKQEQDFITRRLSVGLNVISKYGIYSYFKVSAETYTLKEQSLEYSFKDKLGVTNSGKDEEEDLNKEIGFTTYALGFGYLF